MAADIGPADALRAASRLGPIDQDAGERILALLGVSVAPPAESVVPSVGVWDPATLAGVSCNALLGGAAPQDTVK